MPDKPSNHGQFWQELTRRKVIHQIVVYATAAFVIIEIQLVGKKYSDIAPWEYSPGLV